MSVMVRIFREHVLNTYFFRKNGVCLQNWNTAVVAIDNTHKLGSSSIDMSLPAAYPLDHDNFIAIKYI